MVSQLSYLFIVEDADDSSCCAQENVLKRVFRPIAIACFWWVDGYTGVLGKDGVYPLLSSKDCTIYVGWYDLEALVCPPCWMVCPSAFTRPLQTWSRRLVSALSLLSWDTAFPVAIHITWSAKRKSSPLTMARTRWPVHASEVR